MNPTHNIWSALRTLGENITIPHPDDTMGEMVLQTKALCLDAAHRLQCLSKAVANLSEGRRFWKLKAKMTAAERDIAKMIALAALDKASLLQADLATATAECVRLKGQLAKQKNQQLLLKQ